MSSSYIVPRLAHESDRLRNLWSIFADETLGFAGLAAELTGGAPQHILDIGCGEGHALAALANRYPVAHLSGIDKDPVALGIARANPALSAADFYEQDLAQPFPLAEPVTLAIATLVLLHLRAAAQTVAEVAATLAPGGCFYVRDTILAETFHTNAGMNQLTEIMDGAMSRATGMEGLGGRHDALLTATGLEVVASIRTHFPFGGPSEEGQILYQNSLLAAVSARPVIIKLGIVAEDALDSALARAQAATPTEMGMMTVINTIARKPRT